MSDTPTITTVKVGDVTHTTQVDTKAQLLTILQNLPTAPASGFKSSEFVAFLMLIASLFGLGFLPIFIPATAAVSIWFGAIAAVVLGVVGLGYSYMRFVLKQSNINLLSLALTAYRDVQTMAPKVNVPVSIPAVPEAITDAVQPLPGVVEGAAASSAPVLNAAPAVTVETIAAH